jgi:Flp pilus assembly protein TadD
LALSPDMGAPDPENESTLLERASVTVTCHPQLAVLGSPEPQPEPTTATDEQSFFFEHFLKYERAELERAESEQSASRSARLVRVAMALLADGQAHEAVRVLEPHSASSDYWLRHCYASALIRAGRSDEGVAVFRELVKRDGSDSRPLHALGRHFLRTADIEQARSTLAMAARSREADALVLNDCAVAAMAQNDLRSALRFLRRALARDERCTPALNNAGVCYQQRRENRKAMQMYSAALRSDPDCSSAVHNLAEAYISERDFSSAIGLLEAYRKRKPADLRALERLAWAHGSLGSHDQAVRLLREGVRLSLQKDATLLNNLAVAYTARRDYSKAEAAYRAALSLEPSNVNFRLNYATLAGLVRRWPEVLALLPDGRELLEIGHADGAILRCSALVEESKNEVAKVELAAARARFADDPRFVVLLGFLLACRFDDLDSAVELLRAGRAAHPEDIVMANNLAYALIKQDRVAEARAVLSPFVERIEQPTESSATLLRATWGLVLIREGKFEEGMRFYGLARSAAKGHLLERIEQKMLVERGRHALSSGRTGDARTALKKAIQMASDVEFTADAEDLLTLATPQGTA